MNKNRDLMSTAYEEALAMHTPQTPHPMAPRQGEDEDAVVRRHLKNLGIESDLAAKMFVQRRRERERFDSLTHDLQAAWDTLQTVKDNGVEPLVGDVEIMISVRIGGDFYEVPYEPLLAVVKARHERLAQEYLAMLTRSVGESPA